MSVQQITESGTQKNYPLMLDKLIDTLINARDKQEYHKLLDLDVVIRLCVSEAVTAGKKNEALRHSIEPQLRKLIAIYKEVCQACSDKSEKLKRELCQINQNKRNTHQYLNVAGRFR